ncbi:hypothetical protein A8E81_10845 [Burkholderia cenocepacia]|nr:hypothetical protein A8E75_30750 [Burkholderia cenocepacia]ONV25313.1 hypothetical protein A8E74_09830 [Burkholderia cenocepacia]ONV30563.1 hypothetical protein A8E78_17295 [Burkholderia cenocepacia]ONV33476.1 hypothetical protein A8E77_15995 [Burkholderia cenocepacia]ONV40584.1 hypothetical protein A8E82_19705 [Burkholderia cenocepacia]
MSNRFKLLTLLVLFGDCLSLFWIHLLNLVDVLRILKLAVFCVSGLELLLFFEWDLLFYKLGVASIEVSLLNSVFSFLNLQSFKIAIEVADLFLLSQAKLASGNGNCCINILSSYQIFLLAIDIVFLVLLNNLASSFELVNFASLDITIARLRSYIYEHTLCVIQEVARTLGIVNVAVDLFFGFCNGWILGLTIFLKKHLFLFFGFPCFFSCLFVLLILCLYFGNNFLLLV